MSLLEQDDLPSMSMNVNLAFWDAIQILSSWPRFFKERITLIQRINRYPVDKSYPHTPFGLLKAWIVLSSRYRSDKVIHIKVGCITFYPVDKIMMP